MGHDVTMPLSGQFVIRWLGLPVINLHKKLVSTFTHYEDMKGNARCN